MKLLIISLQRNGAAPIDALEFSNALCRQKKHHTIFISTQNELIDFYTDSQYRKIQTFSTVHASNSYIRSFFDIKSPLTFCNTLTSLSPDTIFSTHFHPWLFFIWFIRIFKKIKWDYGLHENPFTNKERNGGIMRRLEIFFIKNCDRIFCYSTYIKTKLISELPNKKIYSLPLGAYESIFFPTNQPTQKNTSFLFLGRIEPYKGVEVLVDAVEILSKKSSDLLITIAGRGHINAHIKDKIASLPITLKQQWLSTDDINQLLTAHDVIVLPYLKASQSGVISIALATKKPVIVTAVGGLPEQVIDNRTGFIIEPNDPTSLARTMFKFISNKNLSIMMSKDIEDFGKTKLSWDQAVSIYLAV